MATARTLVASYEPAQDVADVSVRSCGARLLDLQDAALEENAGHPYARDYVRSYVSGIRDVQAANVARWVMRMRQ